MWAKRVLIFFAVIFQRIGVSNVFVHEVWIIFEETHSNVNMLKVKTYLDKLQGIGGWRRGTTCSAVFVGYTCISD